MPRIVGVPEIIEGCDEMGVRKGTSRFVAPLAATLKADGSAVFIAASGVFIAQMEGFGENAGKIVVIWSVKCHLLSSRPFTSTTLMPYLISFYLSHLLSPHLLSSKLLNSTCSHGIHFYHTFAKVDSSFAN